VQQGIDALKGVGQPEDGTVVRGSAQGAGHALQDALGHQRILVDQGLRRLAGQEGDQGSLAGHDGSGARQAIDDRQFAEVIAGLDEGEADFPPVAGDVDHLQPAGEQKEQMVAGAALVHDVFAFGKPLDGERARHAGERFLIEAAQDRDVVQIDGDAGRPGRLGGGRLGGIGRWALRHCG
jgi:hypothetical protein